MAHFILMLKAIMHAGKLQRMKGNQRKGKRDGAFWTRIVCVKVIGLSQGGRDRWFGGVR